MAEEIEGFQESLALSLSNGTVEARIVSFLARLSQATRVADVESLCKEEVEWVSTNYPASTLTHWLGKYDTAIQAYFEKNPMPGSLTCTRKTPMGIVEEHVALLILQASAARASAAARVNQEKPLKGQNNGQSYVLPKSIESNEQPLSSSVDKQLFAELNDSELWGEGAPDERLARMIAKAKTADRLKTELELEREKLKLEQEKVALVLEKLKLEQEKVAVLSAQVKMLKVQETSEQNE